MDPTAIAAASGLRARMEALDMLSNNLANASTTGFKLDREFYTLFSAEDSGDVQGPAQLPYVKSQWTDFSQGTLTPTGSSLDFALTGQGLFTVKGPNGPLYTRNGSFQMSASGTLVTNEGYAVVGANGNPIQTQSNAALQVGPDGSVVQDGQTIGQLQIVKFQNANVLTKTAGAYFRNSQPGVKPVASSAVVSQRQLEGSNVVAAESAVRLVGVMRQFEMLQKAIMQTTEMNKQGIQEVSRVGAGAA
jgi:flagellar basal-body rod protein FlgF